MRYTIVLVLVLIIPFGIISCKKGSNSHSSIIPGRSQFETNDPRFLAWLDQTYKAKLYDKDEVLQALKEAVGEPKFSEESPTPSKLRTTDFSKTLEALDASKPLDGLTDWDINNPDSFLYYFDEKEEYIKCIHISNNVYYLNDDILTVLEDITIKGDNIFYVGNDEYFIDSDKVLTKKSEGDSTEMGEVGEKSPDTSSAAIGENAEMSYTESQTTTDE